MTTIREIFTACAPEYLERYPTLPTSHRKVISAIRFGLRHASCAIPPDTIRLMILTPQPIGWKPTRIAHPAPFVACCPPCGGQMRIVMRL